MNFAVLACVVAACSYAAGAVLQSRGAQHNHASDIKGLAAMMGRGWYMAGLACDLVGWLLTIYAVKHLPLFAVYSTLSGSVAITVVLARIFLHTPLRRIDAVAVAIVLVGLVLVGLAAESADESGGGARARVVLAAALVPVALLAIAAVRGKRAIGAAVTAGLLFSLGAAAVRTLDLGDGAIGLLKQPTAWAVLLYLGAGLLVHARSLQHGNVGPVLVASATGYFLFDDSVRPGTLVFAIIGIVLALGATVHLALAPSSPTPT
jgi:drug/metabolite transporter (DMT)-like permease